MTSGISKAERQMLALLYLDRKKQDRLLVQKISESIWKPFNWVIASFLVIILLIASTLSW